MDLSGLGDLLQLHLEASQRERESLERAAVMLESALARAADDEGALGQAITALARSRVRPEMTSTTGVAAPDDPQLPLSVPWPSSDLRKAKGAKRWARVKLALADWYLDLLRSAVDFQGSVDHSLGTEMAIAGVIECLCASFDSAIFALTSTIERSSAIPGDRRTPPQLSSWAKVFAEARLFDLELSSRGIVSEAMAGEYSSSPSGWLAQLQILRARLVREDPLVPVNADLDNGLKEGELGIDVPTEGPARPVDYLTRVRSRMGEVIEYLVKDMKSVKRQIAVAHDEPGAQIAVLPGWTSAEVR